MAKRKITKGSAKANLGRTYRLAPTKDQSVKMTEWGHTARALYNIALAQRETMWGWRKTSVDKQVQFHSLAEARQDFDWIADLPSAAGQDVLRHLHRAYLNWWNPDHPADHPTRKKRNGHLSFSLPNDATDVRHVNRKWSEVWVPKLGWVRFRRHRPLNGVVRGATFAYSPGSGWSVSFGVAAKPIIAPHSTKAPVGVDFGVACSAFLSSEQTPRLMDSTLNEGERRRLTGLERRSARQLAFAEKHNGGTYSHRLRKTSQEIARLRALQARRRNDFTHKLTNDLAKNHGIVGIENLSVKNMTASAKGTVASPGTNVTAKSGLNRGILDNVPYERSRQLAYKVERFGSVLVKVPPKNTSRRCSTCEVVDPENRPGCGRAFACVACGFQDHADHNAACNIETLAIALASANAKRTVGPTGGRLNGRTHNSTGRHQPSRVRKNAGASVKSNGTEQSGPECRVA